MTSSVCLRPRSLEWEVPVEGGARPGGLSDLPSHAILDRERVFGLWEFDVVASEIIWFSFIQPNALKRAVADARSFSLDSPKLRLPHCEQPLEQHDYFVISRRADQSEFFAARLSV